MELMDERKCVHRDICSGTWFVNVKNVTTSCSGSPQATVNQKGN
jgi:hypothetical protein